MPDRDRRSVLCVVVFSLLLAGAFTANSAAGATRVISLAGLRDKIEGGWAGQMIGVSFGAPTEGKSSGKIIEGELPKWTPERVSNSLDQDDLYVDMTFAKVLDDKGLKATTEDFAAMFKDSKYRLWHANMVGRRNLRHGIPAAEAGLPRNNAHANDIDFQIEADFIGLMAPGLYQWSNDMSWRAGRVMNYGDGIYGGMFLSCMYAAAFVENDPRRVVETGLACIPAKSPYGQVIADVLAWSRQNPDDWRKVWKLIEDKYHKDDPCPNAALRPNSIEAKLNGAYVALGLLFGNKDFGRTIDISTRSGQDSDCNPSSAAGVLGVMLGYRAIPDVWKSGIPAIADRKFSFTDFSFRTITASTEKRALALIRETGGRVEGDKITLNVQTPRQARLEFWNPGSPGETILAGDPRWTWKGSWKQGNPRGTWRSQPIVTMRSATKGDEASISFEGTGAIVLGPYLTTGGRADVYLDGKLDRTIEVLAGEGDGDGRPSEAIWHTWGLKRGKHTVRVVVRGEPFGNAKGEEVGVAGLAPFK